MRCLIWLGERKELEIADCGKILERAISDLEFVKGLDGGLREVVVECYVKSFEYTHGRFFLYLRISTLRSAISQTNTLILPIVLSIACSAVATLVAITWNEHKL